MTAPSGIDERVLDEALAWQRALEHGDADWDGYTVWLDEDPRHRQAFNEIALIERIVDERASDVQYLRSIESPDELPSRARRGWLYGGIAAAVALAVGIPTFWPQPTDTTYVTKRGETRLIALGQGVAATLAPSTRLIVKGGNTTKLELVQGDAYFAVAHDPNRAVSIKAGEYAVTDIGTTFGVNLSAQAITVSVAEGKVSVLPDRGGATQVSASQQLIAQRASGFAQLGAVAANDVGSWRHGRLVYNNAPLAVVAADISRYLGKPVAVDPALSNRQFSGVLAIGDGSELLPNLAQLVSVPYQDKGGSARLGAAAAR